MEVFMLVTAGMMLHYQNGLLRKSEADSGELFHSVEHFT